MQSNVGRLDQAIRIIIGIVLLLVGFLTPLGLIWQVVVLVLAAIALITGIIRFCPLWAVLGINTSGRRKSV